MFPTAILAFGDKSMESAPHPPNFLGCSPWAFLHPWSPVQEVWNAPEPCLGFPHPKRIFPCAITVVSNLFTAVRQLMGVGFPLEEQEAHGMGGAGRNWGAGNSRDPRQGSCHSPMANLSLNFEKSLCPAQCPPTGPHPIPAGWGTPRGHSEPLNPFCAPSLVTGGAVPHCHWF